MNKERLPLYSMIIFFVGLCFTVFSILTQNLINEIVGAFITWISGIVFILSVISSIKKVMEEINQKVE
jgi:hypothetical protein